MAKSELVSIGHAWVQLTDDDVTTITVQNQGGYALYLRATDGETAPDADETGLMVLPNRVALNVALTDLSGGATATRVYARTAIGAGVSAWVAHA